MIPTDIKIFVRDLMLTCIFRRLKDKQLCSSGYFEHTSAAAGTGRLCGAVHSSGAEALTSLRCCACALPLLMGESFVARGSCSLDRIKSILTTNMNANVIILFFKAI